VKYPEDFESVVGFDQIRSAIVGRFKYSSTHELASKWEMQTDLELVIQQLDLLDQIAQLNFATPSALNLLGGDISGDLKHLGIENLLFGGAFLKCHSSNDSNIPKTIYGIAGEIIGTALVVCLVSG